MTRSILAISLALGLTAGVAAGAHADEYVTTTVYSQSSLSGMNPDNCSAAWRDCATTPDGSNHVAYGQTAYRSPPSGVVVQQGYMPSQTVVIQRGY